MPLNFIDANGITIGTVDDFLEALLNGGDGYLGYFQIYGNDINVAPNSTDGNALNIFAQSEADQSELAVSVYDSYDPDQAYGAALDRVCSINGVFRQGGTFTQVTISVTTNQALTLPGLNDHPAGGAFTVQDSTGNQYQLITTFNFIGAATVDLLFQAVLMGPVTSAINAITVIATPQLGVVSVINPADPTQVGTNQETDSSLRIRRANSVEQPSQGFDEGLQGSLLNITGVTGARVYQNRTNSTDVNGIPAHSIWVIVAAPDSDNDLIADTIYRHLNAGPGFKNMGTGGAGTAHLTTNAVSSISVAAGGSGYNTVPTVTIVPAPGDPGINATAHAVLTSGVITSFVVDGGGSGYLVAPTVVINATTVRTEIEQLDGNIDVIYFDHPQGEGLFFAATITAITGTVDLTFIAAKILEEFGQSWAIGQTADSTSIVAFIKAIAPNASVSDEGVSTDGMSYFPTVDPTGINFQFNVPSGASIDLS